jgi:hypothetical protein
MAKENECLGCGQKFKQKDASVQCNICGLWSHRTCSGITTEFFNAMAVQMKATGTAYWACRACNTYAAGMNHRLREVTEKAQQAMDIAKESSKEAKNLKVTVEQQAVRVDKKIAQAEIDIYGEMSLREEKRKNVVIHGLAEPRGEDGWTRMEEDRKKLNKLFEILDINVVVETDVEFCRRIGEKSDKPRPLVVGFYTEWAKNTLLKNSKYLVGSEMDMVSIVQDLTEKQRKTERDMLVEAERRNREDLNDQDRAKNLLWKVVGKKGQKRLVKVYDRENAGPARGGRGAARGGRGRGGAPHMAGVALLPTRGAEGIWRPTVGRGAGDQEVRAASVAKRKRSGEEEQGRKRGTASRGRPQTRGRPATASQVSSAEEEEDEVSSQQSSQKQSSQAQIQTDSQQEETVMEEMDEPGEEEEEALAGVRLGKE